MLLVPVQRRVVRGSLPRAFAQFVAGVEAAAANGTRLPALDVTETDSAYTLAFDLPGVAKEQLSVSVQGRRVSVETVEAAARPAAESAEAKPRTVYSERRAPRFARTVSLPAEVDETASDARLDNGVLTLTLAKRVKTGATRIAVN